MKRKSKHQGTDKRDRRARFGHLTEAERLRLVESVFIKYPRLKNLYEKIDFCREFSKIAAEPECMLITGTKGAGKSTLIKWYAGDSPISELGETRIIPVLVTLVPPPATVKG